MMLPYPLRLVCLCLAAFFLIHLALGLAISLLSPAVLNMAGRLRARTAARFLLGLRLLPPALSVFVVAVLCVPSYLLLEPESAGEEVGAVCLAAAALALAIWGHSIARALHAVVRSVQYSRHCGRSAHPAQLSREAGPVWVIDLPRAGLALAGILRPRVFVSRAVLENLSPGQLAAALRHEREHQVSRDNLKRLLLLLVPELFPFTRCLAPLERGWSKFAEWAADDGAVYGNPRRSVQLAAALVRVARLARIPRPCPLVNFLLNDGSDLLDRVDRLLRATPPHRPPARLRLAAASLSGITVMGALTAAMLRPSTLSVTHSLLEVLIR